MDVEVKYLMDYVSNCNDIEECQKYIRRAFDIILQIDHLQFTTDLPHATSTNILIQCSDLAIKNAAYDIAEECLNLFFTRAVATDPNRCVAYLYMAQLSAPTNIFDTSHLEKAGQHITRAINLAVKNPALQNEIYNASLLYWRLCHPFLRPGFYQYVVNTLHVIVKAINDLIDINYNWKAILFITLIEMYLKTGRKSEAVEIAKTAIVFVKKYALPFFKRIFELIVRYQLVDSIINQAQIKNSPELLIFYTIMKLNYTSETKDIRREINKVMVQLNIAAQSSDNFGYVEESAHISTSPREGKKRTPRDLIRHKSRYVSEDNLERQYLLLELTRLCLKYNLVPYAQKCIQAAKKSSNYKKGFYTQFKFAESEIMVKLLGVNQESYSRKSVKIRLKAIKLCEENITIAMQQHDAHSVQCGCVTLWNLSLPLLQSNLRCHLSKPLTLVAQALEDIQSLFIQLRCQVHRELALCEEKEHIKIAISHLKKAIALDGSKVYHNQLSLKLNRLTLLSEMYFNPDNPEDIAGKIIEQAREVKSLGTKEGMRALLIKAGITLAPDAFQTVLDSESLLYEKVKLSPNTTDQLAERVQKYNANIKKIDGHLLRIGDRCDYIRMHLWADLSKVARKHGAWDVCRTAAMFCLLYDDNRWLAAYKDVSVTATECSSADSTLKSEENMEEISTSRKKKSTIDKLPLSEREHVRLLAEINFIQGEACLNLLYQENVKLNDLPVYPQDYSKHGKNYEAADPAEDKDWELYCQWIQQMNSKITSSFLRGLILGYNLNDSYIVGNAATYLWNYNLHIIEQNRQSEIVGCFATLLEGMQKVDYSEFIILLINICINLATGLMMPWMPSIPDRNTESPIRLYAYPEKSNVPKTQSKLPLVLIPPQALPDLKRAIEVCEYAIDITNKKKQIFSIPLPIKASLLKTWVIAKQMSQQQINRNSIRDDDPEKQLSQIIVDIEMYTHTKNGVMEFKDLLPLPNLVTTVLKHHWRDDFLKLQLCTQLAEILYNYKNYELVIKIAKAVTASYLTETSVVCAKERTGSGINNNHIEEKVSYLFLLMGQSTTENMEGQTDRWEAINNFIKAAEFSIPSHNYHILMKAAKNYWNTILPLINISSERKSLKASLQEILSYISKVTNKITELNSIEKTNSYVPDPNRITFYGYIGRNWESDPVLINDNDDDQKLQVSLYNVLCDSYEDSNDWKTVIKILNTAIADLPHSYHKIQLFRRRIMVKAKLGENMLMDLQRFRDEKEDFVAVMWRDIALHSNKLSEQCIAYQKAIESLSSKEYNWQKIDYLLEFSEWLYTYQMPEQIVVDQIEWAIDILMSMTPEINRENLGNKTPRISAFQFVEDTTLQDTENLPNSNINENVEQRDVHFYVPQEKEIIIGAPLQDCTEATGRMNNVKQLNYLIKSYVFLCAIYTPASPFYQKYSLFAYSLTIRLWQVCIAAALNFYLEVPKTNSVNVKDSAVSNKIDGTSKQKVKDKKEKNENCISPTKEKNKKKFLSTNVSSLTSEEWAVFEVPCDLEEIFTHQSLETTGINEKTFPAPMISLYYFDKLVTNLQNIGFHHLTLPVLALNHIIASFVAHSKSFVLYTHCKRMELCAELNLPQCSSFHENAINQVSGIAPNELIEIREKFYEYVQERNNYCNRSDISSEAENEKLLHKCHLGHYFQDTFVYQIWTKTAEALIEQTHYQLARKYLSEAYKFAVGFKDIFYQGKLCFLKAKLASVEAQYKDAFDLCMKAEDIMVGDMEYWYEIAMLKTDAALHTFPKNGYEFVEQFLQRIIKEFEKLSLIRPNQALGYRYTIALIQAKLGEVQIKYYIGRYNDLPLAPLQEVFQSPLNYFNISTEFLLKHKYTKAAVKVMHNHAKLLHQIALATTNDTNSLQLYYLHSVKVFTQAIEHARAIFYDIMMILPKDFNLSLPIHRELSNLQRSCAEVMVEIQTIQTNHEIEKIQKHQHDIERIKLEEEFINKSPDCLETEKEWKRSRQWIANEILSQATSAHTLARTIQWIKSRSLLIIGKCLLNLSFLKQADPSLLWSLFDIEPDTENVESDESKEGKSTFFNHLNQIPKLSRKIKEIKWKEDISLCYFTQAAECLTQALNTAFQLKRTNVIMQASYELMNSIGQFDVITSSHFLALYQSCQASCHLKKLLRISQPNPYSCRLAALLHQRKHMLNNYVEKNLICTDTFSSVTNSLETEWQAWKSTMILTNHFDAAKEFPFNFNFIVLQHSPDKNFIFYSLLDKYKSVKSAAAPKQPILSTTQSILKRSSLAKFRVNPNKLHQLLNMLKLYKKDVRQALLKREFQIKNQSDYKNMLDTLKFEPCDSTISESLVIENDDEWMQEKFEEIVALMEDYFAAVLQPLRTALQQTFAPSCSSTVFKESSDNGCIIILADSDLLELPLESLSVFREFENIISVSRDISLQLFYHRFHQDEVSEETKDKKKDKKQHPQPPPQPTRIPVSKETGKKRKRELVDHVMPPWGQSIDTDSFKYMVDVNYEFNEPEENDLCKIFKSLLAEYEHYYTSQWIGLSGDIRNASTGEWETYLNESGSFIFLAPYKITSYLNPIKIPAFNISNCMLVCQFDLSENYSSYRHLSLHDALKSDEILSLENPVSIALLLSLAGVHCIMGNQWSCQLNHNIKQLRTAMKCLLSHGYSTGETLRHIQVPLLKMETKRSTEDNLNKQDKKSGKKPSKSDKKKDAKLGVTASCTSISPIKSCTLIDDKEVRPNWFNMVCYGLPNLFVTQT
ncbi:cilia- and flagella-associated protein 46 [Octopus bimaculoides]|uniref:Cilia- and flagella-associated protein 46 n=1 Tax=Octopus bimaculoides TaxID=37653 RepID=A0A0L8GLV9_OCTBM|nr:cilia- and flagella-associated protein 46 [Octopus bimaculoides]|eukprot:XP_014779855.1 PREDICTED: cilia- and flagella-associated protein 46-like [Octopus bimaculoides]